MIRMVDEWVKSYSDWLGQETRLVEVEGGVEVTTPFLNRDNDMIQLYVVKKADTFVLTDDGATLRDLEIAGIRPDTDRRRSIMETVLNGFRVSEQNGQLVVEVNADSFASRKHDLIQAVLAIDDLHYTSHASVVSLFFEDVAKWLDENEIRYAPRIKISGKTGFDHNFDFLIPKSPEAPERFLQAVNRLDKNRVESLAFRWMDVVGKRPEDARFYVLANSIDDRISSEISGGLAAYQIETVAWSDRASVGEILKA